MLRRSRYPPSNTHVPGVAGRGTLEAPATTVTNVAETAIKVATQVESAGTSNLRTHLLEHKRNAQQLRYNQSQRMQW